MRILKSRIKYRASSIEHRESNIKYQISSIEHRASRILFFVFCVLFLLCDTTALFAEQAGEAVILQTQPIKVKDSGIISLGEVSITGLSSDAITPAASLSLNIPEDFPAVWDTRITTLSLTSDSPGGLINEAVAYVDEKTLNISVTGAWPREAKITIVNLRIDIPEIPSYEEIFNGRFTNLAYLSLRGRSEATDEAISDEIASLTTFARNDKSGISDSSGGIYYSTNPILIAIAPFYSGDDGWSESGSPDPGVVAGYEFCNFSSIYSPGYYLAGRGLQAVVYAVDADSNWVASTDTVNMSCYLSAAPATSGNAVFYTDATYATTTSAYTLADGYCYIYVKDDIPETIELKASDGTFEGNSEAITIEPYAYTITASSPKILGVGYHETVTLKDIHGNTITDGPPSSVDIGSDGNMRFYPDNNYASGDAVASRVYSLTNGSCSIYVKDEVSENIHITADDNFGSLAHNPLGCTSEAIYIVIVSQWQAKMAFAYDEAEGVSPDKLIVRAWLEKEGSLVNDSDLGTATLSIFDAATLEQTLSVDTPDADGVYWFNWEDTGLTAGRSYFAQLSVVHGASAHTGGEAFYLTMNKGLGELITDATTAILGLQATAEGISEAVINEISPQLTATKADTAKAVIATEETIPAGITAAKQELEPHIYSGILNTETQVASGGALVIRYRAPSGTSPVVDVYNPDQTQLKSNVAMTQIGDTGVYEYPLTFDSSWGNGFFTIICSESVHSTLDGITVNVTAADLETVAGEVSSILGTTSGLQDLSGLDTTLGIEFSDISSELSVINGRIADTIAVIAGTGQRIPGGEAEVIYKTMALVSNAVQRISVPTTGGLEALYEVSRESSDDINYVRNKFIELENLLEINKQMMDTVTYEPIIQSWFEFR